MDPLDLLRLHVGALFTMDSAGRLVAVNTPDGSTAPRFFVGRTASGSACWFRHDLGPALVADLTALCASGSTGLVREADLDFAHPLIARLSREEAVRRTWMGPAFRFPSDLAADPAAVRVTRANATVLSPFLEEWREDVSAGVPMWAALERGRAVSLCASVRVTPDAHEAGVETHPEFRGRGHAARAVAAWACGVREMKRTPLYSTSWENDASRALARKLRLIQYGADLHIT